MMICPCVHKKTLGEQFFRYCASWQHNNSNCGPKWAESLYEDPSSKPTYFNTFFNFFFKNVQERSFRTFHNALFRTILARISQRLFRSLRTFQRS